jgi:GNAT superfamily N-acetyltransferase
MGVVRLGGAGSKSSGRERACGGTRPHGRLCLVALDAEEVIGHVGLSVFTVEDHEPPPRGTINLWQLFVRPDWQGQAVATQLMDAALSERSSAVSTECRCGRRGARHAPTRPSAIAVAIVPARVPTGDARPDGSLPRCSSGIAAELAPARIRGSESRPSGWRSTPIGAATAAWPLCATSCRSLANAAAGGNAEAAVGGNVTGHAVGGAATDVAYRRRPTLLRLVLMRSPFRVSEVD